MAITPDDVFKSWQGVAKRNASPRAAYNKYTPRRVDKNQPAIVKAFRQLGATVRHTHMVGSGFPDIAVSIGWITYLVEIKAGAVPSKRQLTDDERVFFRTWPGLKAVVCNADDVADVCKEMRRILDACKANIVFPCHAGNASAEYCL